MSVIGALVAAGCAKSADSTTSTSTTSGGSMSAAAATTATAGDPVKGQAIFATNCASCHGADGAGGGIGPALHDEKSRKNLAATVAWIKNPQPPMPKLYPSPLTGKDVVDVAAYVESL